MARGIDGAARAEQGFVAEMGAGVECRQEDHIVGGGLSVP